MQMADLLVLDAPHRTSDGYLAVRAKAARIGVQDYLASELGAPSSFKPTDTVRVYRDAAEVFAADSVRSFIGRPITNDHPREAVTSANWRDHARGTVMGAMRDGDYLAFDLVLMDSASIKAVEDGKRELSNGYQCSLDWTAGTTPDGQAYDARQIGIKGNHVALVDKGRAGPDCAIKDGQKFAICDINPAALATIQQETVMKIKIGDAEVDATNGEAVRIAVDALNTKLATLATDKITAETQIATLTTDKAALEAKVTTLDKQVADAKLTPAQLRDAGKAYQAIADKAKALGVAITDEMYEPAIVRAVVTAKLGDAAKDWTDAQFAASFSTLTSDTKASVHNITPAKIADTAGVRDLARNSRYA